MDFNEITSDITSKIYDNTENKITGNILRDVLLNIVNYSSTPLEEILAYGVQWDTTASDPHLTRIGNMSLHKTLPIQSQLKGCIAQGNQVIYWLDENDWNFKRGMTSTYFSSSLLNGIPSVSGFQLSTTASQTFKGKLTEGDFIRIDCRYPRLSGYAIVQSVEEDTESGTIVTVTPSKDWDKLIENYLADNLYLCIGKQARLDGYDGTVRVYCPDFYIKSYSEGNIRKVYISTVKIDNSWTYQPEILVDAYRCTVLNTVPEDMGYLSTLPVNSAISVVNTETYCRGGGNRLADDTYLTTDPFRTDLGKPRTSTTRANMRTYARNAGSELLSYEQYKNIFYWLWVIEYANFNSQEAYNEELTAEGYRQGGMGVGVANCNGSYWNYYNGYYPLTPCGYGNDMGNNTGLKEMTITMPTVPGGEPTQMYDFQMPRWRGFDNPFGDIWTNLDGVIVDSDADNHEDNMDYVYTCQDSTKFGDTITEDYAKVANSIHQDGHVKSFDLGDKANIIANQVGGGTTTYMCDYHWTGNKNTTPRALLVGGSAANGASAGLGSFNSGNAVAGSHTNFGFRSVSSFASFPLN